MDRGVFGNSRAGAAARRDHLLKQRREQLGVMPLEVRRIYVRRIARIVTGMTAFGGAVLLYLEGHSDAVRGAIESMLPGIPAVLTTTLLAVLIAIALSYFVARAFAEDYFTRAMMKAVDATFDLHGDVQRLSNVHPHTAARDMARKAELGSMAWPAWGGLLLSPFVLLYAIEFTVAGGFPPGTAIEHDLMAAARHAVLGAVLTSALTWFMMYRTARNQSAPSLGWTIALLVFGVIPPMIYVNNHAWLGIGVHLVAMAPLVHWFRNRAARERMALG